MSPSDLDRAIREAAREALPGLIGNLAGLQALARGFPLKYFGDVLKSVRHLRVSQRPKKSGYELKKARETRKCWARLR